MPVFIERFLLVVCAAAFFGLVINNSMSLDLHQRIGLGVALVGMAYFLGSTVQKKLPTTPPALVQPASENPAKSPKRTGDAKTSGSESPAVTGDQNSVTYDQPSDSKEKKPPKKNE